MKSKWFSWTWPNFSGRPVDLTSSDVSFADIRSYVSTPRSLATWVWRISTPGLRSLGCFDWQVFFGRLAVWLNRIEYTQHISQYLSCCFLFSSVFWRFGFSEFGNMRGWLSTNSLLLGSHSFFWAAVWWLLTDSGKTSKTAGFSCLSNQTWQCMLPPFLDDIPIKTSMFLGDFPWPWLIAKG